MFGQLFRALKGANSANFGTASRGQQLWNVDFAGYGAPPPLCPLLAAPACRVSD